MSNDVRQVLCVYPPMPRTYWGAEYTFPIIKRRALLPPLGLITVAAMLPAGWTVRLVDMNVADLDDGDLRRADVVFISGMLIQRPGMLEVARRARALGKTVVMGGPDVTTSPERYENAADHIVLGEAEDIMVPLCHALEDPTAATPAVPARRWRAAERPALAFSPVPRFDLLEIGAYHSMPLQWSRGCPFSCEFCDIIEIFGRHPRTKAPEQLVRELDALAATGFRGSVFLADDNLAADKGRLMAMLRAVAGWMRAHGDPFDFYSEASVTLALHDDLMRGMADAGFSAVFLGIETTATEALARTNKLQNTAIDPDEAVRRLLAHGIEVFGGFIVGFDTDDGAAIDRQREFLLGSAVPLAMVGVLTALPGTQLERRLQREGRLRDDGDGDNFGRSNFEPRMDEEEMLRGYARLLGDIYEPRAYFRRALRMLRGRVAGRQRYRMPLTTGLPYVLRSLWHQGVLASYRREYWRFLLDAVLAAPRSFPRAIAMAINGEHMIRFTEEDVLPRLAAQINALHRRRQRRAA